MLSVSAVLMEEGVLGTAAVAKLLLLGGVLEYAKGEGGGVSAFGAERTGNGKTTIGGWLSAFCCCCGS